MSSTIQDTVARRKIRLQRRAKIFRAFTFVIAVPGIIASITFGCWAINTEGLAVFAKSELLPVVLSAIVNLVALSISLRTIAQVDMIEASSLS